MGGGSSGLVKGHVDERQYSKVDAAGMFLGRTVLREGGKLLGTGLLAKVIGATAQTVKHSVEIGNPIEFAKDAVPYLLAKPDLEQAAYGLGGVVLTGLAYFGFKAAWSNWDASVEGARKYRQIDDVKKRLGNQIAEAQNLADSAVEDMGNPIYWEVDQEIETMKANAKIEIASIKRN